LNGNTFVTDANTFTVGTGLSSLGGALNVTGDLAINTDKFKSYGCKRRYFHCRSSWELRDIPVEWWRNCFGNLSFAPGMVTMTIDLSNSSLTLNGVQTVNGNAICLDGDNHVVRCNGAPFGLQAAYNTGNSITTTEGRNIDFTLEGGLTDQTSFNLTNAGNRLCFCD